MGSGIATALILSNVNVVLKEIDNEYLLKGIRMVEGMHPFESSVQISLLFCQFCDIIWPL